MTEKNKEVKEFVIINKNKINSLDLELLISHSY